MDYYFSFLRTVSINRIKKNYRVYRSRPGISATVNPSSVNSSSKLVWLGEGELVDGL